MENQNFRRAYSKLTEDNKMRLEDFSSAIGCGYSCKDKENIEHYSKKMRGYLMCLLDLGIITRIELSALYLYYFRLNQDR